MCGIAGFLLQSGESDQVMVRTMCDEIVHRGPDDEGIYTDGRCGIGMRRLSIIDLATGHQPVSNEDGTIWVVFNGEIYNFQELRANLIAQGHRFKTNSDTETLVHLYEQEGVEGIKRLRGMFAYAIWDSRKGKMLLVRDRVGKKPLYFAALPQGCYFASELKCLRALGLPLDVDDDALRLYLQFGYVPDPYSIFRQVRKLAPGCWVSIDRNGTVQEGRYWSTPPPCEDGASGLTEEEACEEIRRTFDESVRLRMIADVPLGAFLSGGIDSSLVVATMARQSSLPVRTFSIGFDEAEYDELPYARLVAQQYKTEHRELVVRPNALDLVLKIGRYFDEPFADSSAIPTYLVSQLAASEVKVALSGDGGDEFFGGYHSFWDADRRRRFDRIPQPLRHVISATADSLPYSAYGKNFLRAMSRPNAIERYFESGSFSLFYLRSQVLEKEWMLPTDAATVQRLFGDAILGNGVDCMSQAMHYEATAKLAGDILVKVDRMSMANSLEVRSPLLDHCLIELAARIPNRLKTRDSQGKLILLRALGDRLPPELLTRPKKGFGVPLPEWFRGPLRSFLREHLTSTKFRSRGLTNSLQVDKMLDEHDSRRRDNSQFLWLLLVLELWFRDYEAQATGHELPLTSTTAR